MATLKELEHLAPGSLLARRLEAYFATLGLRDGAAVEELVHQVLQRVAPGADGGESEAVAGALQAVQQWLDALGRKVSPRPADLTEQSFLLDRLRRLLVQEPRQFLERRGRPVELAAELHREQPRVLPPGSPTRMLPQGLGSLSLLLRPADWLRQAALWENRTRRRLWLLWQRWFRR